MFRKFSNLEGCLLTILFLLSTSLSAQETNGIRWISFEELEDSIALNPKNVFIDFYADWCTYCRKMDKAVFTKPAVATLLNNQYYAVRFNAESDIPVSFGGQLFINDQIGKSRTPIHQIAQLLALREGTFTAPTLIFLNKTFTVTARHFEYMDSQQLLEALERNQ